MFGLVSVFEDANRVQLLFASKRDAKRFIQFVRVYIAESGAGNGYGAYWYFKGEPIVGVDTKMGKGYLNFDLIKEMSRSICDARNARRGKMWAGDDVTEAEYMPQVGVRDGAITFDFSPDKLPPRIRPRAGDLVRLVDNEKHERQIARVKEVKGTTAVLVPCPYSEITTEIRLPLKQTMKIYDFLDAE